MIGLSIPRLTILHRRTILGLIIILLSGSRAFGQTTGQYSVPMLDFVFGFQITFSFYSVALMMIVSGLFIANRSSLSFWMLSSVIGSGIAAGVMAGALAYIPGHVPAYLFAAFVGLIVAFAPPKQRIFDSVTIFAALFFAANAMFSGYDLKLIPLFVFAGVLLALFLGPIIVSLFIFGLNKVLNYSWVKIAWRALAAWLVAISVILISLSVTGKV